MRICHCRVEWQVSQFASVRICDDDLPSARTELWQSEQTLGVPSNFASAWQDLHSASACAPVSGKPVWKWSNSGDAGDAGAATAGAAISSTASAARNVRKRFLISDTIPHFHPVVQTHRCQLTLSNTRMKRDNGLRRSSSHGIVSPELRVDCKVKVRFRL